MSTDTSTSASWSPVWTTAAFAAAQGVVVYGLFECWRNQHSKRGFYQPRQYSRPHRTPSEPSSAPLSWLGAIGKIDDSELHRMVGMDHYVLLRHCLFGFKLTFVPSLIGAVLMALVYYNGNNGQVDYNRLTMANVLPKSFRLWWPVIFMYIVVLWSLILMWREWKNFVPKRFNFLAEGDPDMNKEVAYAAIVENIPEDKRSSPALYGYFDNLFPGKVSYASLCMDADELEDTLEEKNQALAKIEHAVAQKHLDPPKDNTTKVGGFLCCGGEKVSTESHYRAELQRHLSEADKEHSRISQVASQGAGSSVASSTGFVAFTSASTKLAAAGLSLSGKHFEMDATNAPAPSDVIWENVVTPYKAVAAKKKLANCLWMLGILFWSVPVLFIQGVADLESLNENVSWLWTPDPNSFLYGLISGLLPVVALAVFTALVPIVIRIVAVKFVRMKSEPEVDLYVFKWHFGFRVANLWLIIVGGSLIKEIKALRDDPGSILTVLGSSVPGKSQFFMNTLLVSLLSGLAMDICRLIPVVVGIIKGAMSDDRGKSDRELRDALAPPSINWGVFYPPLLFVLLVVYCYAAIAPLLLPVACALYLGSYLVYKNQALFVYVQRAESGGAFMYLLFRFSMACLYIGELVFVAFIGIKEGSRQGVVAVVLVVITVLWHCTVNKKFVQISKVQCVEAAVAVDKKNIKDAAERGPSSTADHPFEGKAYVQKSLKKSEWETKPEGYRDPSNAGKVSDPTPEMRIEQNALGGTV